MKNLLVAQSGGPSAAINATVAGVVERAMVSRDVDHIYGAINGIKGVFAKNFIDLRQALNSPELLQRLCHTPAAALGSCRLKLKGENEEQFQQLISIFKEFNIGYFVYIGGNDSMDTVAKLSQYIAKNNIEDIYVMGAPKTIDNDLEATDHCPGYGSAAKYIATTFAELERDCHVYDIPAVTIVEVMGRNAGWLTAASALARLNGGRGPQLIYLCEHTFDEEQFICDVKGQLEKDSAVLVAVSEGVKDASGCYLCEKQADSGVDVFGHKQLSGTAKYLELLVKNKVGCKVRSIELSLMQRCASHVASQTDLLESKMLGFTAADCCLNHEAGKMAVVRRLQDEPYQVTYGSADIAGIANMEKKVPMNWITPSGNDVTEELVRYMKPLIQGEIYPKFENGVPVHIALY